MLMKKQIHKRTPEEKEKIILDIQRLGVVAGCRKNCISKALYYDWLDKYTGKKLTYKVYAGHDFPDDLESFAVAIHCGACMINPMEMHRRMFECERRGVPITNYGMTISKVQGVLERVVKIYNL